MKERDKLHLCSCAVEQCGIKIQLACTQMKRAFPNWTERHSDCIEGPAQALRRPAGESGRGRAVAALLIFCCPRFRLALLR